MKPTQISTSRRLPLAVALGIALLLGLLGAVASADNTVRGRVVEAGANRLTMMSLSSGIHSFAVVPDARITLDGKAVGLEALRQGDAVFVRLQRRGETEVATLILATTPF